METEGSGLRVQAEAAAKAGGRGLLRFAFPPQCLGCGTLVAEEGGLCPTCWQETGFITGLVCDLCGASLPGTSDRVEQCDDCRLTLRPWVRGRAVLAYRGQGRGLVLQFKHADRLDLTPALTGWLARTAQPLLLPGMLVVPIPLHWLRLLRRRYNQSAELARGVARRLDLPCAPDLLQRIRATQTQDGKDPDQRRANLEGALRVRPGRAAGLAGRPVLLVDDVMTSGATFAAATEALLAAGTGPVHVLALARVTRDG